MRREHEPLARLFAAALPLGPLLGAGLLGTWIAVVRGERARGPLRTADVIVVFGARAWPDGPSPELRARLDHAAGLWRAGLAPTILCSGGWDGRVWEARVMAESLLAQGVSAAAVEVDHRGASTRRTIAGARRLASGRWREAIAVSSPYHMHRIATLGSGGPLRWQVAPASGAPIMRNRERLRRQRRREVAAVWWDRLRRRRHGW